MTIIKRGDFIEVNYTGRTSDDNKLFDTTSESVAHKEGVVMQKVYKPVIVCAGEGHLLPGLDKELIGKELGTYTIALKDIDAFGKKDTKLLELIPRKVFNKDNINPVPGMDITVDNQHGVVRSVSGGRVIVDFNHPLASKDVSYEVDILRIVQSPEEQIGAVLDIAGVPHGTVSVADNKAVIEQTQELPPQFIELFTKDLVRLTKITDITFTAAQKPVAERKSLNKS